MTKLTDKELQEFLGVVIDTLCGDCEEKEFKYEYHFPHPEEWYWFCKALGVKLTQHSGVRRDARCPLLSHTESKEEG